MPSPSKSWADIADSELDANSGIKEGGMLTKMRDQQIYLLEIICNDKSYKGPIPHEHAGKYDATIAGVSTNNLLLEACPHNSPTEWTRSGDVGNYTGNLTALRNTSAGATAGDHIYQKMIGDDTTINPWGDGTKLVLSFFAKLSATASAGIISVGLADGNTTFKTDHRGQVAYSQLSTSAWKRFFVKLDGGGTSGLPMSTHGTDARWMIQVEATFGSNVNVITSGYMCTIGTELQPFFWAPHENGQHAYASVPDCPIFDEAIAMTNAVELSAV